MAVRRRHAEGVQWFFKEEIKSRGWYTAELRKVAVRASADEILREHEFQVPDRSRGSAFSGKVLEEKIAARFSAGEARSTIVGDREFKLFESWLDRISSWADHDGLVHCLIAPMMVAKPARTRACFAGRNRRIAGTGAPPVWPDPGNAGQRCSFPKS